MIRRSAGFKIRQVVIHCNIHQATLAANMHTEKGNVCRMPNAQDKCASSGKYSALLSPQAAAAIG
jgi:hypothetical protein